MKTARWFLAVTWWLGGLLLLNSSGSAQVKGNDVSPSIVVTGSAEIRAKPDMAQVRAGVLTLADTAAAALTENSQKMTRMLAALAAFGIPEDDVQTSNFSISPQYGRPDPRLRQEPRITGYHVTNQVTVRIRNLDRLGDILDKLVALGSNQIHGVQFSVRDPEALLDQARIQAVREARRKAELLSQSAGVKLGRVLSIRETASRVPRPLLARRAEAAVSVPIAPGREVLSVTVTMVFALE